MIGTRPPAGQQAQGSAGTVMEVLTLTFSPESHH